MILWFLVPSHCHLIRTRDISQPRLQSESPFHLGLSLVGSMHHYMIDVLKLAISAVA